MDFDLSQEHKMWARIVKDFCEAEIKPHAREVDETGALHWDGIRKMREIGLLGMEAPAEFGGMELDSLSVVIAMEALGAACGSTALSLAAHNGLGVMPIVRWGTHAQQAKYLPKLMSGETLGALALTEPGAGSDLAGGVMTKAARDGDSWVIDGTKAWITNASLAPVVTVLLRTDAEAGTSGFSMMLVEPGTAGFTIHPPEKKMGLKGSPTHMLSFEGARVPADAVLGEVGRGFQQTMMTLDNGRIGIGAQRGGVVRLDIARSDGIHVEAVPRPFVGQRLGQPCHTVLGRRIGRNPDAALKRQQRGDVDDRAGGLPRHHGAGKGLRGEEHRFQVQVDHRVPVILGKLHRIGAADDACVVHQNVDRVLV